MHQATRPVRGRAAMTTRHWHLMYGRAAPHLSIASPALQGSARRVGNWRRARVQPVQRQQRQGSVLRLRWQLGGQWSGARQAAQHQGSGAPAQGPALDTRHRPGSARWFRVVSPARVAIGGG
jgi:hypothetical protein